MTERGAYSPDEAATWLGVSRSTVYRLMESGDLPYVSLGSQRRIAGSTLERLVDPVTVNLRSITTEDVARILRGLGYLIAEARNDPGEQAACGRLARKFTDRLAYAEALAAPMAEPEAAA